MSTNNYTGTSGDDNIGVVIDEMGRVWIDGVLYEDLSSIDLAAGGDTITISLQSLFNYSANHLHDSLHLNFGGEDQTQDALIIEVESQALGDAIMQLFDDVYKAKADLLDLSQNKVESVLTNWYSQHEALLVDSGFENIDLSFLKATNLENYSVDVLNTPPETLNTDSSGFEDAASIAIDLAGTDAEGPVSSFKIISLPSDGVLYSDAALMQVVMLNDIIPATADSSSVTVYFVPDVNFNGSTIFQYAAIDSFGAEDSTPAVASIVVTAVNDAPTLSAGIGASVEDGPSITVDLSSLGADVDSNNNGSSLIYTIVGAPSEGNASIVSSTLIFDPLNGFQDLAQGETRDVVVTITATDVHGAFVENEVTITVTGTNDAPTISSNGGDTTASIAVNENQVFVTNVQSVDPDSGMLTYSITDGLDQDRFSIHSSTGELNFIAAPDYENPEDDNGDNVYDVQVTVTDSAGLTDVQDLTVQVNDVGLMFTENSDSFNFNFNNETDTVSFIESIDTGLSLYESLGGDDIIVLPDLENAHLSGFVVGTYFSGGDGNDTITGGNGDDVIIGDEEKSSGAGNDILYGGDGNDILSGAAGSNDVYGGAGDDTIYVILGNDFIDGGDGMGDTVSYEILSDSVIVNLATGGSFTGAVSGISYVQVLTNVENLIGSGASDTLTGDAGDNIIQGLEGNDIIYGGDGNDQLYGGAGDDVIIGLAGSDILDGGAGADHFVYSPADLDAAYLDTIDNFESGVDKIDVSAFGFTDFASSGIQLTVSGDTIVDINNDGSLDIIVTNVALTEADFLMVI